MTGLPGPGTDGALSARGPRVQVRPVEPRDVAPFRAAVEASRQRIGRWNPVDPERAQLDLAERGPTKIAFLVLADDQAGSHGIVGRVSVSNVVQGRFRSASLGYDAYDPYAGQGLFGEGLRLVVDLALRPVDGGGLGLHRVEANVQPGNAASAGVLRSLGFRHEGETPRMLWLEGPDGAAWRDHERYAVTVEEWPAEPYAPHRRIHRVVLVDGPGPGRAELARALAAELALPVLPGTLGPARADLLASCPSGAVLDGAGLMGAVPDGAGGDSVVVWCGTPSDESDGAGAPSPARRPPSGALVAPAWPAGPGDIARLALRVRASLTRPLP